MKLLEQLLFKLREEVEPLKAQGVLLQEQV